MLSFSRLDPDGLEALDPALARVANLPFIRGYGVAPERARAWTRQLFGDAAAREDGAAIVARSRGRVVGGAALVRTPWESEIFDLPMARVTWIFAAAGDEAGAHEIARGLLGAVRDTLRGWGVRHCSALVPAEATGIVHAFGLDGWRLVDSSLEYTWSCGRTTPVGPDPRVSLRVARASDREVFVPLARDAFTRVIRTRFSADPWLPIERTGELYVRWLELALDGEFADVVVAAEVDGRPIAFSTFKLDPGPSRVLGVECAIHGISAVDPEYRGLATTPAMLHWVAEWQRERGGAYNRGRVLTSNYAMQRACFKSGGYVTQAYQTFHTLLDPH